MASAGRFDYAALDRRGRKSKGYVFASSPEAAFETLKQQNLTPVRLRRARPAGDRLGSSVGSKLTNREIAALLGDLALLLKAGADMRTALSLLEPKTGQPAVRSLLRHLESEIAAGEAMHDAFQRHLPRQFAYIAGLVAGAEAAGNLATGLERSAEMLENRIRAQGQLVSALSYPVFVLVSAVIALAVILLFVVPSLAPLAASPGAKPGLALVILLQASHALRLALPFSALAAIIAAIGALACALFGVWNTIVDRAMLSGPFRAFVGPIIFGGFAVSLGNMLSGGTPVTEALRLSVQGLRSGAARADLTTVQAKVREGKSLSNSLAEVASFPPAIVRLAMIGEQSGALGPMLIRAGRFEEQAALRRIEASSRIVGPVLILALGALIGLMMAGLLSSVSGLGEAALN